MSKSNQDNELQRIANRLADSAAHETLRFFRSDKLQSNNKIKDGGFDPVTVADRNAEKSMREILQNLRPLDSIIGEEFGTKHGQNDLSWVLDPIDGTRAYICGATSWGTLIGIERDGHPVFGIIDQPYLGERFIGGLGLSELKTNSSTSPLKTRRSNMLDEAILLTTFPEIGTAQERLSFEKVRDNVKLTRYGLDCYGYALLALGQVDLVIEAGLNRYDISAPIAVVEAAGGIVTNWQGGSIHDGGQVIAAGDRAIHAQAVELLNS